MHVDTCHFTAHSRTAGVTANSHRLHIQIPLYTKGGLGATHNELAAYTGKPDALTTDKANRPMEISAHPSTER